MTRGGRILAVTALMGLLAGPAQAENDQTFMGTEKTARALMDKIQKYVAENGHEAAFKALHQEDHFIGGSDHHVSFHSVKDDRVFVERHSEYESLQGADMTAQQDLDGKHFIKSFLEDVRSGGGVTKLHLEVQEVGGAVRYACMNEWLEEYKGKYFATICFNTPN